MKKLKELFASQHCKLVAVNKDKTSIAFLMPAKYGGTRVSSTPPKPLDQLSEKELMNFVADSVSGARKK